MTIKEICEDDFKYIHSGDQISIRVIHENTNENLKTYKCTIIKREKELENLANNAFFCFSIHVNQVDNYPLVRSNNWDVKNKGYVQINKHRKTVQVDVLPLPLKHPSKMIITLEHSQTFHGFIYKRLEKCFALIPEINGIVASYFK